MIEHNEFDTIYHEHFSYFSLISTIKILQAHGLRVFDVEELKSHGGSLRVFATRANSGMHAITPNVQKVIDDEIAASLDRPAGYESFAQQARQVKMELVDFLLKAGEQGKKTAGYGAPGKSATLLQSCGLGKDMIEYTVDRSPHKQGKYLPGSRIPIFPPDHIRETKPDYVVILPWNLKNEIMEQLEFIREWGGKFVVPIPRLAIL